MTKPILYIIGARYEKQQKKWREISLLDGNVFNERAAY